MPAMTPTDVPATIFETERLLVRPWTVEDAPAAFAIFGDPEVARFAGPRPESVEVSRARLERWIEHFARRNDGLGFWAVVERASGAIVGEVKLVPYGGPLEDNPEVELGYFIARPHWGRGYATEAARGALRYGFERLGLPRIWVMARCENGASLRVIAKLGARHVRQEWQGEKCLEIFCLERHLGEGLSS
jgi:[ribosomal protein S5]-alanine N-acetyltransferase